MTHEDLRKRAVRWLTTTRHCGVVLSELSSAAWECPDAIGWQAHMSILIECKVSRSDFLANAKKNTLADDRGAGNLRYFMAPSGLLSPIEVSEKYPGYGLLSVRDNHAVSELHPASRRETNERSEIAMLVSALRRIKTREFLTLVCEGDIKAEPV